MSRTTKDNWFVYIAEARTGRLYVGISTDPKERVQEHNQGKGAYFARLQGPFKLAYQSQAFTKSEAAKREKQLKGWTQIKKKKLISGEWS